MNSIFIKAKNARKTCIECIQAKNVFKIRIQFAENAKNFVIPQ